MKVLEFIKYLNNKIAIFITNIVGTMNCAYIFTLLVLIPLIFPDTINIIQFISSSFLQLVLLPIILLGQKLQEASGDARSRKDHKMIKEELSQIKQMKEEISEIRNILKNNT